MAACNPLKPVTIGDTFNLVFPILNSDGSPATFSSPQASFALAEGALPIEGDIPILEKNSPNNGLTITQQSINSVLTWVATVYFLSADTQAIDPGNHFFWLRIVDGVNIDTVATGLLQFNPGPTWGS